MFKSAKGLSAVELLVATAIASVVLAGICNVFLSASKRLILQSRNAEIQADARAAMDFMVRELRLAFGNPTISTTVTANDTISFDRVEDAGCSSGVNTATTLEDTRKTWPAGSNGFGTSYTVRIIAGTGTGQVPSIGSNTSTKLTIVGTWATIPDATSCYVITRRKTFTRTSASDNVLRYTVGSSVHQPLAELITTHAFSQTGKTLGIIVTAQTNNIDPNTGAKRTYTLTEIVLQRNN
jgi:Tfp pilus assembly protein PilW